MTTRGIALVPALGVGPSLAAKRDARGVKDHALESVATDRIADHEVIGSGDGGARKLIYVRGGTVSP